MTRPLRIAALLGLTALAAPAQDAASPAEELSALRKAVEQQAKQIEALTHQVAKLAAALEGKSAPTGTTASTEATSAPNPEEFSTTNVPKAEPAQPHHIVVKGETLTSIAKQYNVPLAELLKANKGINERKIQIGQSILLPSTPSTPTTPAPASETKPNP